MNIISLVIPIYDWRVEVFCNVTNPSDIDTVKEHCSKYNVTESVVEDMMGNLIGCHNSGNHLYNSAQQLAFLFFTPIDSELGFWKIVPHEIDHLVDSISEHHRLEREGRGYLTGFIFSSLYQLGVMDELKRFFYVEPDKELPEMSEDDPNHKEYIMSGFLKCMGVRVNDENNSDKLELFYNLMKSEFSNKTLEDLIISAENKPMIEGGI